jgi:hypothetical protein
LHKLVPKIGKFAGSPLVMGWFGFVCRISHGAVRAHFFYIQCCQLANISAGKYKSGRIKFFDPRQKTADEFPADLPKSGLIFISSSGKHVARVGNQNIKTSKYTETAPQLPYPPPPPHPKFFFSELNKIAE